jgi:hypothetical protein
MEKVRRQFTAQPNVRQGPLFATVFSISPNQLGKRCCRRGEFKPLGLDVPPPESAAGRGTSLRPSDRAYGRVGERRLPPRSAPRKVAIRHKRETSPSRWPKSLRMP